MASKPNQENLSESFGFAVSKAFEALVCDAITCAPEDPCSGLSRYGLTMGGPLYDFLGGSPQSLRTTRMPPEFFPFAVSSGKPSILLGFLVDAPSLEGTPNTTFAVCVPGHPQLSGVVARSEEELIRWLEAHKDDPGTLGLERGSAVYQAGAPNQERLQQVTYRTADKMGVVVEPENTPLGLLHEELRCRLIEKRDLDKVRQAGISAIKVGAPGAALALARDITWWLGHRDNWFSLAIELYEQAYSELSRPLLLRISKREWVRFYGKRP